jgi:hypothetical protein
MVIILVSFLVTISSQCGCYITFYLNIADIIEQLLDFTEKYTVI